MEDIECAGFTFISNFDSGNLAQVELVTKKETTPVPVSEPSKTPSLTSLSDGPQFEFNLWTKQDCHATEFENPNRTWFHFGIKGGPPFALVKLNLVNLNKQAKLYSQGMTPVCRTVPGKPHWERTRDRPTFTTEDGVFTLSFKFICPENLKAVTYFAFTYPYSYTELQGSLMIADSKHNIARPHPNVDDIYYVRECVCKTLEGRRVDLITISSYHNITSDREVRLKNLFPDEDIKRPFKFLNKKVIFLSARVHPGETPSSFVLNGFLKLLLNRDDNTAITLRKLYVFKLIPMLNPDGVVRGHYRTDTRGVNLNRLYLEPSPILHPSVYAAKSLIRYYHYGAEIEEDCNNYEQNADTNMSLTPGDSTESLSPNRLSDGATSSPLLSEKVSVLTLNEENRLMSALWCSKCKNKINQLENEMPGISNMIPEISKQAVDKTLCQNCLEPLSSDGSDCDKQKTADSSLAEIDSGLFLYIDMHGHASNKGIFMYGNYFNDTEKSIECMLLPKLMSINNFNFHFSACNFNERNMYRRDRRDGMSREGSGRVAVLKLTGLVRSYTLECNYNTGRMVNVLPPTVKENTTKAAVHIIPVPPKYTPQVFEEVGRALGVSILDLTGDNSNTRIPNCEFRHLTGIREYLRQHYHGRKPMTQTGPGVDVQVPKVPRLTMTKPRSLLTKGGTTKLVHPEPRAATVPVERKENIRLGQDKSSSGSQQQPGCSRTLFRNSPSNATIAMRTKFTASNLANTMPQKEVMYKVRKIDVLKPQLTDPKAIQSVTVRVKTDSIKASDSEKTDFENETETKVVKSQYLKQGPKRIKIAPGGSRKTGLPSAQNRLKLQEIQLVKSGSNKKLVAKYNNLAGTSNETEDLILSWNSSCIPKILSVKPNPVIHRKLTPPKINAKPKLQKQFAAVKSASSSSIKKKTKTAIRKLSSSECSFKTANKIKKRKKKLV